MNRAWDESSRAYGRGGEGGPGQKKKRAKKAKKKEARPMNAVLLTSAWTRPGAQTMQQTA